MATEKRLIDREDALAALSSEGITKNMRAHRKVAALPTVDAVEVVRCGECKHLTADGLCWEKIRGSVGYKETSLDDFCSYGERRRND